MFTKELLIQEYTYNKLSTLKIGEKYHCSDETVRYWLKKYNIPKTDVSNNLIGYKTKYLEVIDKTDIKKYNEKSWICKCVCGNTCILTTRQIHTQITCGCNKGRSEKEFDDYLQHPYKEIIHYWYYITNDAKRRNLELQITSEKAYEIFLRQNKKCALSNIDLRLKQNNLNICDCASLDRIDSSKGYTEDNVQWIHKKLNFMKNILSNTEFIYWCTLVENFTKDPIFHNNNIIEKVPEKYFKSLINNTQRRYICLNITINDLQEHLIRCHSRCNYTGLPISFQNKTASIDRIDSNIGYIHNNIQWVHKIINRMKMTLSHEEFISYCANVYYKSINLNKIIRCDRETINIDKQSKRKNWTSEYTE